MKLTEKKLNKNIFGNVESHIIDINYTEFACNLAH